MFICVPICNNVNKKIWEDTGYLGWGVKRTLVFYCTLQIFYITTKRFFYRQENNNC